MLSRRFYVLSETTGQGRKSNRTPASLRDTLSWLLFIQTTVVDLVGSGQNTKEVKARKTMRRKWVLPMIFELLLVYVAVLNVLPQL